MREIFRGEEFDKHAATVRSVLDEHARTERFGEATLQFHHLGCFIVLTDAVLCKTARHLLYNAHRRLLKHDFLEQSVLFFWLVGEHKQCARMTLSNFLSY